ncbi:MAG: DUF5995 family protein [Rhodothermales bacterium]|nr:DUF5995 family protein [Rhodothermales bacterium]
METAPPQTIDAVLARLDALIGAARRAESRMGYFAALYRGVTARVKAGIEAGRFEDPARMARLDVVFARRYLDAYDAYARAGRCSACWTVAFDAAATERPIVLQHLLAGMNAHIDLDLGIAAAEVAPGAALPALEHDFNVINQILVEMLDDVQDRIARVSPWMAVLDRLAGSRDEALARLGLRGTRRGAWLAARHLAMLADPHARDRAIEDLDRAVTLAGQAILKPPGRILRGALWLVRRAERRQPSDVIDALLAASPA